LRGSLLLCPLEWEWEEGMDRKRGWMGRGQGIGRKGTGDRMEEDRG